MEVRGCVSGRWRRMRCIRRWGGRGCVGWCFGLRGWLGFRWGGGGEGWRNKLQQFVHRHAVLDTYRGPIVDRNGVVLAQDVPSDELAIDYRAMNFDDAWLKKKAVDRLRAAGKWGTFVDRAERDRVLA